MTPTPQKKMYHHHFLFLTQNLSYSSSQAYQVYQHLPFHHCIYLFSSWVWISIFNLTRISIESLLILYVPLQLFWNHNGVVDRLGTIHTSFNKIGIFLIPFQNWFFWCSPGLNMRLLWIKLLFCGACWDYYHSFPSDIIGRYFLSWLYDDLKMRMSCIDYPSHIVGVFLSQYQNGPSL